MCTVFTTLAFQGRSSAQIRHMTKPWRLKPLTPASFQTYKDIYAAEVVLDITLNLYHKYIKAVSYIPPVYKYLISCVSQAQAKICAYFNNCTKDAAQHVTDSHLHVFCSLSSFGHSLVHQSCFSPHSHPSQSLQFTPRREITSIMFI